MKAENVQVMLRKIADPVVKEKAVRFFKTGKGDYAEQDRFLGIRVPELRRLLKKYFPMPLKEVEILLRSAFHEERLFALLILVKQYALSDSLNKTKIFKMYVKNIKYVNNWDLVDSSAQFIIGHHLEGKDTGILYLLCKSESIWERRIAILSTFHFIKKGSFGDTLKISKILLSDHEDLIHKAVGWMLREIGSRDLQTERLFLDQYFKDMPRVMLRYAIEKFPHQLRQSYLKKLKRDSYRQTRTFRGLSD